MAGRPTDYKKEYCEQVEKLCKLGATDSEIADFFQVSESTLNLWKLKHQQFSESIKRGKLLADANVADRLYQRALGFEHDSEEIKVITIGKYESAIERVPIRKIYPPDATAAIFWLKNRQKGKWRDKIEHGFTDGEGNDRDVITLFQLPDNGRNSKTDNPTAGGLPNESPKQSG